VIRPEWRIDWVGLVVALALGALVRFLKLPIPAPPAIAGSLMIVALTVGYLLVDALMRK
jgi:XapX domain-containing protein